jgi:hypothetical protein
MVAGYAVPVAPYIYVELVMFAEIELGIDMLAISAYFVSSWIGFGPIPVPPRFFQ